MDRVDPSGNSYLGELAIAGVIGVTLLAISVILVGKIANAILRTGVRDLPTVSIETQPVILEGSDWDWGDADLAMDAASDAWMELAHVKITALPIKEIKANIGEKPDYEALEAALSANNISAKHVTVFTLSLGSTRYGNTPTGSGRSVIALGALGYLASQTWFPFLFDAPGSFTVAHEWGHTFNLSHSETPGNLMQDLPFALTFGWAGWGLTDDQARTASSYASHYR